MTKTRLLLTLVRWKNSGWVKKKSPILMGAVGLLVIGAALSGTYTRVQGGTSVVDASWDLVVLGRIDFCLVCQWGPSSRVRYTQVLAGSVPDGQARGELVLGAVARKLLPEGGVPIYKSQHEEICFLKKMVVPGYAAAKVYEVVDILEATPENLAAFRGQ